MITFSQILQETVAFFFFLEEAYLVRIGVDERPTQAFRDLLLVLERLLGSFPVRVEVSEPREQHQATEGGARRVKHQFLQKLRLR